MAQISNKVKLVKGKICLSLACHVFEDRAYGSADTVFGSLLAAAAVDVVVVAVDVVAVDIFKAEYPPTEQTRVSAQKLQPGVLYLDSELLFSYS